MKDVCLTESFTKCYLHLRPAFDSERQELDENTQGTSDEMCIRELCDSLTLITSHISFLLKKIVCLFVTLCTAQFRKDYLTSVRREKTKALRKRVMMKSIKKDPKVNITFIRNDKSKNKVVSHLKLKSESIENSKFYMDFKKTDLLLLSGVYECQLPRRQSQEDIGTIVRIKIQTCNDIPNPNMFSPSTSSVTKCQVNTCDQTLTSDQPSDIPHSSEQQSKEPSTTGDQKSKASRKARAKLKCM